MKFVFDNFKATHAIIVVNGYFPSLSIKRVLKAIIEDTLGYNGAFRNVFDQVSTAAEIVLLRCKLIYVAIGTFVFRSNF